MSRFHLQYAALLALTPVAAPAGNIVWVSDQFVVNTAASDNEGGAEGRFGVGTGPYADDGLVALLRAAGHTLTHYNPPASPAVLSDADIAQLNTFDLVILSRSLGSASFDTAAECEAWNVRITKPVLSTNVFLVRRVRLGWFTGTSGNGETGGNVYTTGLTFADPASPAAAWLLANAEAPGGTTTESIYRRITTFVNADRGQNFMTGTHVPVAGSTVVARAAVNSGHAVVMIPGGSVAQAADATTSNGGTSQVLGGFRMLFTAGNQEPSVAPENVFGNAGFNNLTRAGEAMFLRAVQLAINGGVVPGGPGITAGAGGLAVTLTWSDPAWRIQASDSPAAGGWEDVPGASPLTVPVDRAKRFFRLWR